MEDEFGVHFNKIVKLTSELIFKNDGKIKKNIVLAISLATKIRNSCSSIMNLVQLGFNHDARIILRSMSEALIILHEAITNENIWDILKVEEYDRSKRLLKKSAEFELAVNKKIPEEIIRNLDAVKSAYDEIKKDKMDLAKLANKHGCLSEYYYYYALCNAHVHSTPNVLSKYLEYDPKENKINNFIQMPEPEDDIIIADVTIRSLFKMAILFDNYHNSECSKEIALLFEEYEIFVQPKLKEYLSV